MRYLLPSGFRRHVRILFAALLALGCVSVVLLVQKVDPFTAYRNRRPGPHTKSFIDNALIFFSGESITQGNQTADEVLKTLAREESSLSGGDVQMSQKSNVTVVPSIAKIPSTTKPRFEVTMPVTGQLGNRLMQYASLLGIAHMNNMTPFYPTGSGLDRNFEVTHLSKKPSKGFKGVSERNYAAYDPKFEHLPQTNVMCLQYFQSWRYFDLIRDEIRKEFTFKPHVKAATVKLMARHANQTSGKVMVGIHIRRGDMLLAHHVRRGYHTAPGSYIRQAMGRMRQKHGSGVVFVVVTQDLLWFKQQVKNESDYVIVDGGAAEVHLAVLASCHHVIMTVGTYGWWGGYLAGGDVVYWWKVNETLHNPPIGVEIRNPDDFYPPAWIPLPG